MNDKPESTSALRKLLLVIVILAFHRVPISLENVLPYVAKDYLPASLIAFMKWDIAYEQIVLHAVSLIVALLLYRVFIGQSWLKTEALVTKGKFVPPWPYLAVAALIVAADLAGSFLLVDSMGDNIQFLWQMDAAGISVNIVTSIMVVLFGGLTVHSLWQKIFIERGLAANIACVAVPVALTMLLNHSPYLMAPFKKELLAEHSYYSTMFATMFLSLVIIASAAWAAVLYKKEGNLPWIMILMFLCALL